MAETEQERKIYWQIQNRRGRSSGRNSTGEEDLLAETEQEEDLVAETEQER